ncbi:MAG TPA: coproporphyrinogen III oxidase [Verrucomicrobiales bacterium]|nr:coproporphyrinogen III oxidase [Verrucomicrobiales bacterium]HRJ10089.1 coproporphyrinogen-III oxidase family protein [Prosthecobacter sp.]HRK14278.1 coproporphyrinogen-III oxidase family protein [Prosthecobacter sp.]
MSSTLESTAPAAEKKVDKTEAGNYFVSNYPPFSFWKPEQIPAVKEVLARAAPADVPLGVYFHIPFCRKRCHFCYFKVYTDKNAQEIKGYIDAGMREMAHYAAQPYIAGRSAHFVYFGGGTPSYLSVPQLKDLTRRMKDLVSWEGAAEVAFEAEPGTLNEKKLEGIREVGVTRLSLGVENFDDHILETNGRAHRSGEIEKSYRFARTLGFEHINIDLISGMMNETEENWRTCVEKAVQLGPDAVTIYQMEVPYNTTMYQQMKAEGKVTAPVADWPTKRRWVSYAFDEFVKAGYTVTSAYTVVKDPRRIKFIYRDSLWEGSDLLSCGVASFGHLGGVHYQNQADIGPYMQLLDAGVPPIFRAYQTNSEERFVREFILKMKLGRSEFAYYQEKFGVNPRRFFAQQLEWLAHEGFASLDDDSITLTRDGLLQVDRLLHDFFLPQHRQYARYT